MKLKIWLTFFLAIPCLLNAMVPPESPDKKEEETTSINLSKLSLAQQIMHIIAQNIATHIVKDKALTLLKAPPIPLLQNLPQEPKTAIDEAFKRLRTMYTQEITEDIALTTSFHLLFCKESSSNKQLYLKLMLPYLSEKQKAFFTIVKNSILSVQNVLSPNTPLKQGFKINNAYVNAADTTMLHFAAYFSNTEAVLHLISLQGLINQTCSAGETPMLHAIIASSPSIETIKLLLEHGADSIIEGPLGYSALNMAFTKGRVECIKALIEDPKLFSDDNFRNKVLSACFLYSKDPEVAALIRSRLKETGYYKELPKIIKLHLAIAAHNDNFFKYYDSLFKDLIEKNEALAKMVKSDNSFIRLSPLDTAALFANTKAIQWLTAQGEDINKLSSLGCVPLHLAIINHKTDAALLLIELGADIEMPGPKQNTPLLLAIQTDNDKIITELLDKKANIHVQDIEGDTPLHIATRKGNKDLVKHLIQKGANLAIVNGDRATVLHLAAHWNHIELVNLFLDLGISANSLDNSQGTPLMEAALSGNESMVRLLIDKGATINARDSLGRAPLYYAIRSKNLACIKALIDAGATLSAADLYDLLNRARITDFSIDKLPIELKEIIALILNSLPQENQIEIIHEALESHLFPVAKFLLAIAPKLINLKNAQGHTPLHASTRYWSIAQPENLDTLLAYGASLEIPDNDGNTPLHLALTIGNDDFAKLLITKGAPLDTPNDLGLTPLAIAIVKKNPSLVRLLVEHGASVDMPLTINIASGSCNVTAINLAEKEGLTEILKILTERK